MFTPQQIDQISFSRATFGGYDMQQVDEFLEPLTEDYVTLYKENALLKSKMRVLVGKLEEYRKNEASMKDALVNAQKTCDKILSNASATAAQNARNNDALIAAEDERLQEARKAAAAKIDEIQEQMRACMQALERIKTANYPQEAAKPAAKPYDFDAVEGSDSADAVADAISQSLEALVGSTQDTLPKAEPRHPVNDTTTGKFANLQFGRNYDVAHK